MQESVQPPAAFVQPPGSVGSGGPSYPVTFDIDYPDRPLSRASTFFRVFYTVPIWIIIALLSGASWPYGHNSFSIGGAGLLTIPVALMLLFRGRYPRWWFDWQVAISRFGGRIGAYIGLLRDEYPSTEEEQAVHVTVVYPNAKELSPWLPLIKWLLLLPHYLVLGFLAIGAVFCIVAAWFAILFTGRYPRGLFDYVVGVQRWGYRMSGYAYLLVTDKYPPFSTEP